MNNLNYKQHILTSDPDTSNIYSTGPTTVIRTYHLGILSVPLILNWELGKFFLTAGIRAGFGFIQRYKNHVSGELFNVPYDVTNKNQSLNANRFRLDCLLSFGRQINSKLSVSISGYHSAMKVKIKSSDSGFYNYQTCIGLNFFFN